MQSSVLTHEGLVSLGLELARYNELVGEIYEGALDPKLMARALKSFLKLYDANFATLILRVPEQTDTGVMILAGDIEGAGDVCYMTYPQTSTPFANQPLDHVFTVDDIMSSTEWEQNVYFKMFCGPHDVYHLMGADISTPDGGKVRFRVTRPKHKPNFSANERALCASFLPHLRRASQLHNLIDRSESLRDLYSQAISRLSVATLVLDESGSVLQSNPVADEILARSDGLKLVGGRLEATYPSDNRVLQQLIRSAFDPDAPKSAEAMSVTRPSGLVNLGVVVESIPSLDWAEEKGQPAALVYIRDASSKSLASEVVTKQLFNLTRAETALAMELANGLSLEEAAEALNIRRNTARAHLRSIFSKTGVRRQTELVRIMLNSVVALGKPKPTMKVAEKIKVPPPRLSAPIYNHA